MATSTTGLTGGGLTANFQVQYEDSLGTPANTIANANALLALIENEFNVTTGWFNTPGGQFGTGHRQVVNLNKTDGSGANNSGYGNPTNLDAQSGNANHAAAASVVEMVFMNEWVEILMSLTGGRWNAGDSNGEALSQYCGIVRFRNGHYAYYNSWVDQWLNQHPRQNWVSATESTDGNAISFGCSLAFIYYLNTQLNFSINQIIAAGAANLASIYSTLTGDPGDPYAFFAALLEHVYPSSANAAIPGPVSDNPFPLAIVSFWSDKNTFGRDEVQDAITTSGGVWSKAFWLIVEGFSQSSFQALGVTVPAFTGTFADFASGAGITITQNPAIDFENGAHPNAPQRIRIPFDITFTAGSLMQFPSAGSQTYELDGSLTIGGNTVPGSRASLVFELLAGADPYFTNIDPNQNNVFYLSQDLRVFTATPAQNGTPVSGAPPFPGDSTADAFTYIQQLLGWLNTNFSDPTGADPFSTVLPAQGSAFTADSSVTPITFDFSNPFNPRFYANYNFAVARVRLRGPAGPPGTASNVRVFFRLWCTETPDTDYLTATTYPSALTNGLPSSPQVGSDHVTLPFFASPSGTADYAGGGTNIHDVTITSGDSVWRYYGCFLNVYDATNVIDGRPVQQWLTGTHHCLVAQIAYDGAPIPPGIGPESSDKLAQRNLQFTLSDNPGPAATHIVPQTFNIRPSDAVSVVAGVPDELMIDWGAIPSGSVASIYWPQVQASDVVALASQLYSTHTLSAADANTVRCTVSGGVTYVPIPAGAGADFAGLFTVELPTTVVTGDSFDILVRRVTTKQQPRQVPVIVKSPPSTRHGRAAAHRAPIAAPEPPPTPLTWRYVTGTFQVTIPVSSGDAMLWPEMNTLAIMKWRLQEMAPSNRWYPVLQRYISYVAARVDGLGGDSSAVLPSPTGVPADQGVPGVERCCTGKVCEVLFDCFGDFEGFVLSDCEEQRTFRSRERGIGELVLRACAERLVVCVYTSRDDCERICRIAIRC
ncbi:MAG: hypothetical protein M3N13_04035 [Candidatus Eremiobacteraeota bacterium]|nr:hypothetical protein [Candidatus Eremiobacteraeota bacterium]